MANLGAISVAIVADTKRFNSGMRSARSEVSGFAKHADGTISTLQKSLASKFGAMAVAAGSLGAVKWGVGLAAEAEQANVAFKVLLGSQEKATKLQKDIQELAAATPFQLEELRDGSRNLAAFGFEAERIPMVLRRLGDLAAGTNQPIKELAEIFGKAKVQGRLFMEDINQLTGRGIPVIQELAKQFGVAESEVRKLVETGKVNFGNLQKALESLTADGGKFGGLMAEQSKTIAGQWSTVKDSFAAMARELGTTLLPTVQKLLTLTEKLVVALKFAGKNAPGNKDLGGQLLDERSANRQRLTDRLETSLRLRNTTSTGFAGFGDAVDRTRQVFGAAKEFAADAKQQAQQQALAAAFSAGRRAFGAAANFSLSQAVGAKTVSKEQIAAEQMAEHQQQVDNMNRLRELIKGFSSGQSTQGLTNSAVQAGTIEAKRVVNAQRNRAAANAAQVRNQQKMIGFLQQIATNTLQFAQDPVSIIPGF